MSGPEACARTELWYGFTCSLIDRKQREQYDLANISVASPTPTDQVRLDRLSDRRNRAKTITDRDRPLSRVGVVHWHESYDAVLTVGYGGVCEASDHYSSLLRSSHWMKVVWWIFDRFGRNARLRMAARLLVPSFSMKRHRFAIHHKFGRWRIFAAFFRLYFYRIFHSY